MTIKFSESGHPVFRATSPLSRGTLKSKGCGKLSIHFCADEGTIETVFRTIISVNQLSIYGAVSDLCEEYGTCQTRTERPVLAEQSDPFFAKLVTDLIDKEHYDDEHETSTTKTEVFAFAHRSKAKAKPRRSTSACSSTRIVPILERIWIDIEPGAQSDQAYPVAKRLENYLEKNMERSNSGVKDHLRNKFEYSQYWSDNVRKSKMAGGGGNKKRLQ